MKPEVETKPNKIDTSRLAVSLLTRYTINADSPDRVMLNTVTTKETFLKKKLLRSVNYSN